MKRSFYWVHPQHLKSGCMTLLETRKIYPGMIRVKVTLAPAKGKKK